MNYAGNWIEQTKIIDDTGGEYRHFGQSVSISGDYVLIGSPGFSISFYKQNNGNWNVTNKIPKPPYLSSYHLYGINVSIDGDYAIIGSPEMFDFFYDSGYVYIYINDNDHWLEDKIIKGDFDELGLSCSVKGDYVIFNAYNYDSVKSAVSIYKKNANIWEEVNQYVGSNREKGDGFGQSISISDDYILIGARNDNNNQGSAHIFKKNGENWQEIQILIPENAKEEDYYGGGVAINNNYAFISSYKSIYNFNDSSNVIPVCVFKNNEDTWLEIQQLIPSDSNFHDDFGYKIGLTDSFAFISAPGYNHSQGAVYVFQRNGDNWEEADKLIASDGVIGDGFGRSLSISGDYAIIGASGDDDIASGSGAVYIYKYESNSSINPAKKSGIIEDFHLYQNYPNPFNPSTIIHYSLPQASHVSIEIYNLLGQKLESLVNEYQAAGEYRLQWQPEDLPNGVYFVRLKVEAQIKTMKLILQK